MRIVLGLPLVFFMTFFSCNKKNDASIKEEAPQNISLNNGLGSTPQKINGYMYASFRKSVYNYGSSYSSLRIFAFFGDPERGLLRNLDHITDNTTFGDNTTQPNVSVGQISFAGFSMGNKNTTSYSYSSTQVFDYTGISCGWTTEGNGSFKALNTLVSRGFPKITTDMKGDTTSKSADYIVKFSNFISNYDSVIVKINSGSSSLIKRVGSTSGSVTFKAEELSSQYYSSTTLSIMAFNYSNMTVEGKSYLLELSNKLDLQLIITP